VRTAPAGSLDARTETAPGLLAARARREPGAVAYRSKHLGLYEERTWSDFCERVARAALGFRALGLRSGERVAILADPCEEWLICDLATQAVGAIPYGIYPTAPAGEVEHLLRDGGASFVVAQGQEFVDRLLPLVDRLPTLRAIVVIDAGAMFAVEHDQLVGFDRVLADGEDRLRDGGQTGIETLEALVQDLAPQTPACLLYTSGTTGPPRGVAVTHRANLAAAATFVDLYPALARPGQRTVAHLPLGHPLGRQAAITLPLVTRVVPHFGESLEDLPQTFFEVAPTVLITVPRYLERFAKQVLVGIAGTGRLQRWAYETATAFGRHVAGKRWSRSTTVLDRVVYRLLHGLALRPILNKLGFDRLELVISGGAPLPPETGALWQACGVNVVEIYGQAETSGAPVTGQRSPFPRPGDVGVVAPGWEVEFDDEGEVLVKGRALSPGRWQDGAWVGGAGEEAGWLRTGDAGEWRDGALRILGRSADLTSTPGGRRLWPSSIESVLRESPFIAEAVVFAGGPVGPVALFEIDYDAVAEWARGAGVSFTGYESLAQRAEVTQLVQHAVERVNPRLAVTERIQRFRILPVALDPGEEGAVVTPTRKVKRQVAVERFRELIESMAGAPRSGASATP